MKGQYYAELYDGKQRRSLSLRTSDPEIALQRYGDGMKALADKIRREHQAARPKPTLTWLPSEPAIEYDVPDGMELTVENLEKHGISRETTAGELLPDEQLRELTWQDLVENARDYPPPHPWQGLRQGVAEEHSDGAQHGGLQASRANASEDPQVARRAGEAGHECGDHEEPRQRPPGPH